MANTVSPSEVKQAQRGARASAELSRCEVRATEAADIPSAYRLELDE